MLETVSYLSGESGAATPGKTALPPIMTKDVQPRPPGKSCCRRPQSWWYTTADMGFHVRAKAALSARSGASPGVPHRDRGVERCAKRDGSKSVSDTRRGAIVVPAEESK